MERVLVAAAVRAVCFPIRVHRAQGQASDIDIQAKEILRMKEELNRILADHTGQSLKRISKDTDRDNFLSPDQAKEYGLIDRVIEKRDAALEKEG